MSFYQPNDGELAYLGFRIAGGQSGSTASTAPLDIEKIIFKICLHLQEDSFNGRLASVLASWMMVHGDRIHVDRLRKLRKAFLKEAGRDVLWLRYFGYYNVSLSRHNWGPLANVLIQPSDDTDLSLGADMAEADRWIRRWGMEPFLPHNSRIRVHKGALRLR